MTFKKLNATSDIDLWPWSLPSYWLEMYSVKINWPNNEKYSPSDGGTLLPFDRHEQSGITPNTSSDEYIISNNFYTVNSKDLRF